MRTMFRGLLGLALVAGAACSDDGGGDGGTPAPDDEAPVFEDAACPTEITEEAGITCGYLVVPADREDPDGPDVRLFVTRMPSRTAEQAPDPVLVLQGGPGDTPDLAAFAENPLRDGREVIVLDQRGTGRSEPSLACPEVDAANIANYALDGDDLARAEAELAAMAECRRRLVDDGVDLADFDSAASAADVADLREALGIEVWNLSGNSYGTRLALTVLRDEPEGVRSASLGGPYPPSVDAYAEFLPQTQAAFDAVFAELGPEVEAQFDAFVARLEAEPVLVTVTTSDGTPVEVLVDGDFAVAALRGALYQTDLIPAIPTFLAAGDPQLVAQAYFEDLPATEEFAYGVFLSVHCQEEFPFSNLDAQRRAERTYPNLAAYAFFDSVGAEACEVWDVPPSAEFENDPVTSDVPTLILTGEYDPATPPVLGEIAAETLPNSYLFEFPATGHDVTVQACAREVRHAFFDDPNHRPEVPCAP